MNNQRSGYVLGAIIVGVFSLLGILLTYYLYHSTPTVPPTPNVTPSVTNAVNPPSPDKSFSPVKGNTITTEAGTTICTGDIIGPKFEPDNDPDTGEIVVSKHAGVQLNFPNGGYCQHFASDLQGQDLSNTINAREVQQKCRDGIQQCSNITEYDV